MLVEEEDICATLEEGVGSRETGETAADDNDRHGGGLGRKERSAGLEKPERSYTPVPINSALDHFACVFTRRHELPVDFCVTSGDLYY